MKKILVAGKNFDFFGDIIRLLIKDGFEIRYDKWEGHTKHNKRKSKSLLSWANIIIVNWCLGNAVWYSNNKLPHQKLFIRFHRFEINTKFIYLINYKNVDKILFVSSIYLNIFQSKVKISKEKLYVLFNPISTKKFDLEKNSGSKYNIGMLGYNRKLKRPDIAIDIIEDLNKEGNKYFLFLKGRPSNEVPWIWKNQIERDFFTKLSNRINTSPCKENIIFEPWSTQVELWFRKIGFILSTSDIESFHCAVAEGMAAKTIPMITGWKGSSLIYPNEFIKQDAYEISKDIITLSNNHTLLLEKQEFAQNYSKVKFDLYTIYNQFLVMFLQ